MWPVPSGAFRTWELQKSPIKARSDIEEQDVERYIFNLSRNKMLKMQHRASKVKNEIASFTYHCIKEDAGG
ncbi:hypothetical protein C5167_021682 [Papaver somniferum]|uniref:Uncharacterized protein n=1 Tax=Papaver somniferum TaxID=3469 RepID=A0A4Y7JIP8_PAPSO|nr:hypothetical protein C5167_021682 [Papaver somniferum]